MKKFYSIVGRLYLFATVLLGSLIYAQNPPAVLNYSFGFEEANWWVLSNYGHTNQWIISDAVARSGTKSLYITDRWDAPYNLNEYAAYAATVHAYRDFTIPTDVKIIELSFDWRALGERYNNVNYDYMRVWLVPSSFVPTASTKITSSANRILLDNRDFLNQSAFINYTKPNLDVSQFSGSTMRLIFEWTNDIGVQNDPPAAIDNISLKLIPCVAPASQPTALSLSTVSTVQINGSFTAASSAPSGYLVVRSPSATLTQQPLNGTNYSAGNTFGNATVVSAGATTSFASTGLTAGTRYYYFVFAYNNTGCAGGPMYNTAAPLQSNQWTQCAAATGLAASSVTHNSAVLSWTGSGSYIVEYGPSNFTPGTGATAGTTGTIASAGAATPYTVTGLTPNRTYDIYVRAVNCPTQGMIGVNSVKASIVTAVAPCAAPTSRPTNLVFNGIASTQLIGSFTGSSPAASGYLVIRSTASTVTAPSNGVVYSGNALGGTVVSAGASLSFTDTGLAPNTKYFYTVFPYTSAATCSGSPVYLTTTPLKNNAVTCMQPPTAPTATAITANGTNLSWTASPAGGTGAEISYIVEIFTNNFATLVSGYPVNNGVSTSRAVSGLSPAMAYQYRIKANNGCNSSYISGTFTTHCAAPSTPTNLSGTATTTTTNGSFNAVAGAAGYLVLRSATATPPAPTNGTSYAMGSSLGGATVIYNGAGTTITDSGLTPNTLYHYFVFSFNSGICSNGPVYSTVALPGSIVTCPLPPTTNTATSITQTSATLNWVAPAGGNGTINYSIEVSFNNTFTSQITGSPFTVTATNRNITGLVPGTTYHYRIRANSGCNSEWLVGVFGTLCATPVPPTGVTLALSGGTVTGTIGAPTTVPNGYVILRSASATAPVLTQGKIYTTAADIGGGYDLIRGSNNNVNTTTFTDSPTSHVYYYIYSFNSGCNGGPVYSSAASARINACAPASTSDARYISEVKFLGTLSSDTSNSSGYTTGGYQNYSGILEKAKQITGGVINVNVTLSGNVTPPNSTIKAWVDWDKDGIFNMMASDTAGGEKVFDTSTAGVRAPKVIFGFLVPASTAPGVYTVRIRASSDSASFEPCGSTTNGETEDYTFEIIEDCAAKITSVTAVERCGSGEVILSATGTAGITVYRWYTSEFGPAIVGENSSSLTVPNLPVGTHTYYVSAYNGNCESADRTPIKVTVRPTPTITFTQNFPDFCGTANTVIVSSIGNKEEVTLLDEKFEDTTANPLKFINSSEGDANSDAFWQIQSSPFVVDLPYTIVRTALSSGFNGGKFANIITDVRQTTDIRNQWVTINPLNTVGVTDLKLDYYLYYFSEEDIETKNYLKLQYSLDGNTWTDLKTYLSDVGVPSRFQKETVILPPSLENQTQLKLRFSVFAFGSTGEWIVNIVALDNVRLYGNRDLPANFLWSRSGGELLNGECSGPVPVGGSPSACVRLSESDLESRPQISVTASAALANGCSASGTIVIQNNNKVWNSTNTNWAEAHWKPAAEIPTADHCVTVKQPVTIGIATNGLAKNIKIEPTGTLNIAGSLRLKDEIVNNAAASSVVVESDGGLIQENEGNRINTGSITARRNINVSAGRQQYNYLISPLEGQGLKNIYPGIDFVLYHNEANGFFYNSSGAYIKGRALAVKEPKLLPGGRSITVGTFTGYPTNGAFTYDIVNSGISNSSRGYNLTGNPYPSNMDLITFYELNKAGGTLSPTFHLWDNRANSQTVQMGDQYAGQAYAIFNAVTPPSQGTGTRAATGDPELAGTTVPTRSVKVGQGFMVKTSAPTQQLIFNNTIRTDISGTAFYGKDGKIPTVDRFWLNMITPKNLVSNIAVVYFDGGTIGFTQDDSPSLGGSDEVYSVVEGRKVTINGRSTFTPEDVVSLGSRHFEGGQFTIGLAGTEGVFASGQLIYLKDKSTGIITNLSEGDYSFSANTGESTGRFEIIYKPGGVLATDDISTNDLTVYRDQTDFVVISKGRTMNALQVFDTAGRLIYTAEPKATKWTLKGAAWANGVYILKIDRGGEITGRKIIK